MRRSAASGAAAACPPDAASLPADAGARAGARLQAGDTATAAAASRHRKRPADRGAAGGAGVEACRLLIGVVLFARGVAVADPARVAFCHSAVRTPTRRAGPFAPGRASRSSGETDDPRPLPLTAARLSRMIRLARGCPRQLATGIRRRRCSDSEGSCSSDDRSRGSCAVRVQPHVDHADRRPGDAWRRRCSRWRLRCRRAALEVRVTPATPFRRR